MSFKCTNCSDDVPLEMRHCPVCATDAGFPNVRLSTSEKERAALAQRVEAARASARRRGADSVLEAFSNAVLNSKAVMNRSLGALQGWVNGPSPFFPGFHQQVRDHVRVAEDNTWDQQRTSAENTINPLFYHKLQFAALSLDRTGLSYYGPYCIVLKDKMIAARSSVFEENPFVFNKSHSVISGESPPHGYRAIWQRRNDLAVAKLGVKIDSATPESQFPAILLENRRDADDCDFIEVHIYEMIHVKVIEAVSGPVPKDPADQILWQQIKRKLRELGARVDEL